MLYLNFSGVPKAVQSFRFTRSGHKYQPTEVVSWKNYIKLQAIQQLEIGFPPMTGPVSISVRFVFPPLKSFNKAEKAAIASGQFIHKITKPDLTDNLMKGFIDALSGITWECDQQICKQDSEKVYGQSGYTELWFMSLKGLYR